MAEPTIDELMDMTDEDFAKMAELPFPESSDAPSTDVPATPAVEKPAEGTPAEEPENNTPPVDEPPTQSGGESELPAEVEAQPTNEDDGAATPEDKSNEGFIYKPAEGEPSLEELQAFYKALNTPFKANGRDMQIRDAQEAIALMQQGVNYTKRMQEMAPQRKLTMMLERHGLTDPNKLAYLIDLNSGNPEAIKKLLIDSKFDPMEFDQDVPSTYQAGNHQVSDGDLAFRTQIDELMLTEGGQRAITEMAKWDQASQDALYKSPSDMRTIHQHMQSGLFDQVSAEIDRYTALGAIPLGTPFIQAYVTVAQEMHRLETEARQAQPAVVPPVQPVIPTQEAPAAPAPMAVRVAPVSKTNVSDGAIAAASPRQVVPTQRKELSPDDIMNMSEEEFAKLKLT